MEKSIRINERDSFVAYSLPGRTDHYLIQGKVTTLLPSGPFFVFQNFDKRRSSLRFLGPEKVTRNGKFSCDILDSSHQESTAISDYLNLVEKTIERIQSGLYEKVVISKIKVLPRSEEDMYELFQRLKNRYPSAFVFLYHIPGMGWWCGASPEILLTVENQEMTTMALAGTQKDEGKPLHLVQWGEKERHEQAVIENYVEDVLHKHKVKYSKKGPNTVRAAQLLHLQSTFRFETDKPGLELAEMLHPGPAICGIPEEGAFSWIINEEAHQREQYCGYIGPWGIDDEYALFVNLRSMRVFKNKYQLYLGGGITAGSNPSSEWDETEQKAMTLASVFGKSLVI